MPSRSPSPSSTDEPSTTLSQAQSRGLQVPRVPWAELEPEFIGAWDQGEHLAAFGPNGVGKSYFLFTVVEARVELRGASAVIFANKRRDATLSRLLRQGWRRIEEWPPTYDERVGKRLIFWPPYPGVSAPKRYQARYLRALDGIMAEGYWSVVFDEARYWTEQMGFRSELDEMWTGSRSNGITIAAGAQGPSWINVAMKTELQWGAFWRPQHRERAKDTADITGDRDLWPVMASLRPHEFILGQLRTDRYYITKLPKPGAR